MKKLLAIVVLGLLFSGNAYAETLESIEKKYRGTLPECKGGVSDFAKDKLAYEWNNCFGTIKVHDIVYQSKFVDGGMTGKTIWTGIDGGKMFVEIDGNGKCKRTGYFLSKDGILSKDKFNKKCEPISRKVIKK